ncbi:MAG TPA: sigma-54 dependent transcriptional regulator [Candidatus Tectomicrobia bacterium]|nr:sigma-54 dependent transcriptional regulator [Candidatus Tectomicrobia bacterium]
MAGAIHILAVDDDVVACDLLREVLEQEGYQVSTATTGQEAIDLSREVPIDLAIIDIRMPDVSGIEVLKALKRVNAQMPVLMTTAYSSMNTAIEAIREGAYDYLSKPCKMEELSLTVKRALEQYQLLRENQYFRQELREKYKFENIVGTTPGMLAVYKTVARLVDSKATVLIQGESGTGKELIARAIHFNGPRAERPFVAVECASLAESLLESELFGHVRGAFTGAVETKKGLFETADGGTIFLDEIAEISLGLQAKLLRVLQEHEIRRVGSTQPIQLDVRVIAATNKDVETLVKAGRFREDLFYRLNVVTLHLPPLRERQEDIALLANHFLRKYSEADHKLISHITPEAMELLCGYHWPGNVRELEHTIERAVTLTMNSALLPGDLPPRLQQQTVGLSLSTAPRLLTLEELEKQHIQAVLRATEGNKKRAAQILGINRRSLYRMAKRYGLDFEPAVADDPD